MNAKAVAAVALSYGGGCRVPPHLRVMTAQAAEALVNRATYHPQEFRDALFVFVIREVARVTDGMENDDDAACCEAYNALAHAVTQLEETRAGFFDDDVGPPTHEGQRKGTPSVFPFF